MANVFYPGSTTNILISKESTYGTVPPASPGVYPIGGYLQSLSVKSDNDSQEIGTIGARATQQIIQKGFSASMNLDYFYQEGVLIAYALGTDSPVSSGPTTHTISLADSVSSFSSKISSNGSSNIVQTVTGCVVDKLSIKADINSPLSISADIVAQSTSFNTTSASTYAGVTDTVLAPQFAPSGNGVVYIGGVTIGQVQNFTFNVNNNVQMPRAIGDRLIKAAVPARRTIDWSMKVNLEDATGIELIKEMLSDSSAPYAPSSTGDVTTKTLVVEFDNQGAGAARRDIKISCTGYAPSSLSLDFPLDGLATMDVSGKITTFDTSPVVCIDGNSSNYILP